MATVGTGATSGSSTTSTATAPPPARKCKSFELEFFALALGYSVLGLRALCVSFETSKGLFLCILKTPEYPHFFDARQKSAGLLNMI
jgi:hypothetical protein